MFITFEGLDGSGKTTQVNIFGEYLQKIGKQVIITKEPGGGGDFSMEIRHLLSKSDTLLLSELFAIYAARNEHIQKVILPALHDNCIVLCDRFIDSTIAFYCYKTMDHDYNSESRKLIRTMHAAVGNIMPDLTMYLDIEIATSLKRINYRNILNNKYDTINIEDKAKIRKIYSDLALADKKRIKIIDANRSLEEVSDNIIQVYESFVI